MTPQPTLALHELHDGDGVPLVLLHAFPVDHRVWGPLAERLPARLRAVAVDLPGQGHSDLGGLAPDLGLAAEAVHRSLRAQGIASAVVVGMSMGGYVALALAERHPGFVAGLGLVDSKSTADTPEARANRLRVAHDLESSQTVDPVLGMPAVLLGETSLAQRRGLLPVLEGWVRGQSPAALAWAQRAMADRPDRTAVLERFDGPVAVVVGAEDTVTPLAEAEHMAHAAADGALTVVPGAGHLSALEDPATVAGSLALLHRHVVHGG
ncbi:alpha/beta hydrolase [Xylanimonas oleitrophica]|uniref:Alpha/beta hydrolase n=1 Tax=Xylanimonas oleitrophica TaxID=2607479 RepID=A0A2W5YCU3_9MICO|nr:alpha/beta fold hydrolase [Xylanimonas oleitrophica]PZR52031.1 alpha/beta hydrolase [Xylanimonas oleitrophica]